MRRTKLVCENEASVRRTKLGCEARRTRIWCEERSFASQLRSSHPSFASLDAACAVGPSRPSRPDPYGHRKHAAGWAPCSAPVRGLYCTLAPRRWRPASAFLHRPRRPLTCSEPHRLVPSRRTNYEAVWLPQLCRSPPAHCEKRPSIKSVLRRGSVWFGDFLLKSPIWMLSSSIGRMHCA